MMIVFIFLCQNLNKKNTPCTLKAEKTREPRQGMEMIDVDMS